MAVVTAESVFFRLVTLLPFVFVLVSLSFDSKPRRELVGFRFPALGETSGGVIL